MLGEVLPFRCLAVALRDHPTMRWLRPIAAASVFCLIAPSTFGAVFETLTLKDGQRITGEVVAEKQNALYVDLGYDLLRIPRDQVVRRTKLDEVIRGVVSSPQGIEADPSGLFSTG